MTLQLIEVIKYILQLSELSCIAYRILAGKCCANTKYAEQFHELLLPHFKGNSENLCKMQKHSRKSVLINGILQTDFVSMPGTQIYLIR